ncbi:MAG: hypothetical protein UU62_C0031G0003 [Candidatus Uhrbacteria bacterium GW2011_GWF2_41_40]|nr:MAG: hypothetical protein UU62_C0031G0003 [Candidatus Uhrbacteria bacterium GW2011_GWF2_41_40]
MAEIIDKRHYCAIVSPVLFKVQECSLTIRGKYFVELFELLSILVSCARLVVGSEHLGLQRQQEVDDDRSDHVWSEASDQGVRRDRLRGSARRARLQQEDGSAGCHGRCGMPGVAQGALPVGAHSTRVPTGVRRRGGRIELRIPLEGPSAPFGHRAGESPP